jgi:hypothetical protein
LILKKKHCKYTNGLYGLYEYDDFSDPSAARKSFTDGEVLSILKGHDYTV